MKEQRSSQTGGTPDLQASVPGAITSTLNAIPDPVVVVRAPGELVWTSVASRRFLPQDRDVSANRDKILAFAVSDQMSDTLLLADFGADQPTQIPVAAVARPATWSDGRPVSVITLRADLVEQTLLVANVSHEVRTPLNAILGYTSMLAQGVWGEMSERQRKSISRIEANAQHLLALINDILDMSQTDAGKMPVRLSRFDLPQLIREILAEVEPLIAKSGLPVYSEIDPGLASMRSDRRKVKQIVLNLLGNALKFTHHGHVRLRVESAEGDRIKIDVEDTGVGIAEADHAKVFEDFQQVAAVPRRAQSGAGLGLAICRRFADLLGATITLKSAIGDGSTFTVVMPREIWGEGHGK